jgi:hypothetical protein
MRRRPNTGHLAKRPEARADLFGEQLRLLPGREVPTLVELVVMDEVGIGLLCPTPRHLVDLVRKDAHRYRDGDALRVEEADRIFPIETSRRDPVFVNHVWMCRKLKPSRMFRTPSGARSRLGQLAGILCPDTEGYSGDDTFTASTV